MDGLGGREKEKEVIQESYEIFKLTLKKPKWNFLVCTLVIKAGAYERKTFQRYVTRSIPNKKLGDIRIIKGQTEAY